MDTLEAVTCCGPLAAATLSDEEAAATAKVFRALADETRRQILELSHPRVHALDD